MTFYTAIEEILRITLSTENNVIAQCPGIKTDRGCRMPKKRDDGIVPDLYIYKISTIRICMYRKRKLANFLGFQ